MCPSSALLFLRGILLVLWAQLTLASGSHVADICRLPPETGPCLALFRRWYYNPRTRRCQTFIYGGCKGNANNFETFEECRCRCVRPREARQGTQGSLPARTIPLPEKFGECPAPFKDNDVLCGELCSTDASCPGSERCCRTMCGHRCQLPLEVIPGYCPKVTLRPDWATICLASCSSDMECALGVGLPRRKCCNYGCHQLCLEAEEEHPGVCPAWRIQEPLIPCNDTCNDDRDCLLTQKCCFTGCRRACRDPVRSDRCQLPPKVGPCKARIPRYFYSPSEKKCLRFYYGGCQGNSNNFETKKACEEACGKISPEVCNLPSDPGPCYGYSEMYYYNNSTGTCEVFVYGLCGGNGNRFSTKLECMMVCGNRGKPGRCPKPTGAGICVELCSSDQDCEGRLKCCSNGCGHVCMTPIF